MTNRPIRNPIALLLGIAAVAGCTSVGGIPTDRFAAARLVSAGGAPVGTAQIIGAGDRLTLKVVVAGMPSGIHGIHLHATGRCDAPAFTTAGAHLNPAGHRHGTLNPGGSHLGDLPNLTVAQSDAGTLTAALSGTRQDLERVLFDTDGTVIVIHAAPDDYTTDPSGNSGARIACGVLLRG